MIQCTEHVNMTTRLNSHPCILLDPLLQQKKDTQQDIKYTMHAKTLLVLLFFVVCSLPAFAKKRRCKESRIGAEYFESKQGPYYTFSGETDSSVNLPWDPAEHFSSKMNKNCRKACLKHKTCGAWRTVLRGTSAGMYAGCQLYETDSYILSTSNELSPCGRAACFVGECK